MAFQYDQISVLLVEDNPLDARLIRELLADVGNHNFELEWVDRLSAGIERLDEGEFQIVLLDLSLPDSQGIDTLSTLLAAVSTIPIIVLTGLDDEMIGLEAVQRGAQDYLIKGQVDSNLLARAICYAIERRRLTEQLHERRRALHLLITSIPNVLLVVDETDRLSSFFLPSHFPPLVRKEKLSAGDLLSDVLPGAMAEQTFEGIADVRRTGITYGFEQVVAFNGNRAFFRVKILPIADTEDTLIVIDDITDLKQAEEVANHYAAELESRNQELDAFSHTVAHDLKTPLSAIKMIADMLIECDLDALEPKAQELIFAIHDSSLKMDKMISSLLLLSRLRSAEEVVGEVDMRLVVQTVLDRLQSDIHQKNAIVEVDDNLPIALGYGPWLEEVFANLISNALKYAQEDRSPHIAIGGTSQNGTTVRYEVQDNGVGIKPQDQARLFEMFSRFHPEKASGHGLGLSIVHRIVTKLNGRVGVESQPEGGSNFWFELPTPANSRLAPRQG
ncbi:MAG: response regulator [Anaerolineae bacterium]|nr:response regulator [Anaerolineae bacterium]